MNYDFFADKADKIEILDFIFNETDLRIFDLSSAYGQQVGEYKTKDEIINKFNLENGSKFILTFQLWSPAFGGEIIFRRVALNPKACNGHTFRYETNGWGLIQLYFGGMEKGMLNNSHIGHFNQKGALKWEGINTSNGKVNAWNWNEIEKASRNLKHYIHNKLAVNKLGSYDVLNGAKILNNQGILLGNPPLR